MKKCLIAAILSVALLVNCAGCGSSLGAAGAGMAGGFAASETMKGLEADLARREQELIDRYKAAVEAGAKQETLDKLDSDIQKTQYAREGVTTTKTLLGVDWNDPAQSGSALAKAVILGYAILTGRKLKRTKDGVNKFMGISDPDTAGKLHDCLKAKKVNT